MTYNVFGGTLSLTQSINHVLVYTICTICYDEVFLYFVVYDFSVVSFVMLRSLCTVKYKSTRFYFPTILANIDQR